jgi:hypothetical protein
MLAMKVVIAVVVMARSKMNVLQEISGSNDGIH